MSENGNGGGSIGGDSSSDSSLTEITKVCRDFMRNVCQRGRNCRFLHPENIKVRTDPIFCHDFQQGRCFRSSCKFIHCTREDEDHFKQTGELPEGVSDPENRAAATKRSTVRGKSKAGVAARASPMTNGDGVEIPICKDFLKGMCDRPRGGCKFRHVLPRGPPQPAASHNQTYGHPVGVGVRMMMVGSRRKVRELYDQGPEAKRYQQHQVGEYEYDVEDYEADDYEVPLPPPPPPRLMAPGHNHNHQGYYGNYPNPQYTALHPARNGYLQQQHPPEQIPYFQSPSHTDAMKALEDENFMLKRRIEELKSSNEFLLNQNAQLRLNNTLSVGTSVAQVQPLAVSAVSVSAAGPAAQPSIIGITSSSLTGTQPLPTISISTLPTVTPVSISQTLQPQPQSQPQIYLPAPPN